LVPHPLRSAAAALDRGDLETAKQTLEGWTPEGADLEDCSELWWLLGRHADQEENRELAAYARIRSREIEIRLPRPSWACSLAESERIVAEALSRLPRRAQELLQAIPLLLEDFPSQEDLRAGMKLRLLGVFEGVPLPHRSSLDPSSMRPDRLRIFLRNLENVCGDADHYRQELQITVWHETAHYFGLEEDDVAALGLE